jgi:hypothetical protein
MVTIRLRLSTTLANIYRREPSPEQVTLPNQAVFSSQPNNTKRRGITTVQKVGVSKTKTIKAQKTKTPDADDPKCQMFVPVCTEPV